MTDRELDTVFSAVIKAKKTFRRALAEGADMKSVSKKEHDYYEELKQRNYKAYNSKLLFITAYLGELDRMIMHYA